MKQLTILQVNDTHSYLESHCEHIYTPEGVDVVEAGGYARLRHIVGRCLEKREHILLLDNGDTFHGTYDAVASEGWNMVEVMKHMGYDAMTFHWDAAYTPANLKKLEAELGFPVLAINCYDKETKELYFRPYMIKDYGAFKVAVIGIASSIIDKTMPARFSEGVYFTLGDKELPGTIQEVREKGADLVILLSHNGFPQDVKMLSEIPGVDICLSGHTHNRLGEPVKAGGAYVIQSGSHGSFMGKLEVFFEENVERVEHELIFISPEIPEDPQMKALVEEALAENREMLSEKVGSSGTLLHRATSLSSPMDNLILKSLLHASDAQMAFSNGWRYGAPIPPGELTLEDLYRIIPVNPPVSTAILSGREIWDMLEENLRSTYAADAYKQMGGYVKRVMGLKVFIKIENPDLLRLQSVYAGDEPLDKEKEYKVAYVTRQGVPRDKFGHTHQDLDIKAIDAIRSLLKEGPFIDDAPPAFEVI